ncbi:MAG: hypothetical protein AAGA40_18140 [Cyanobacteria bacterium P01_E01_bin.45]
MTIKCILWDFGDTLVDESWMRQPPAGFPDWPSVWSAEVGQLAAEWDIGNLKLNNIVEPVAKRLNMSFEDALAHLATPVR